MHIDKSYVGIHIPDKMGLNVLRSDVLPRLPFRVPSMLPTFWTMNITIVWLIWCESHKLEFWSARISMKGKYDVYAVLCEPPPAVWPIDAEQQTKQLSAFSFLSRWRQGCQVGFACWLLSTTILPNDVDRTQYCVRWVLCQSFARAFGSAAAHLAPRIGTASLTCPAPRLTCFCSQPVSFFFYPTKQAKPSGSRPVCTSVEDCAASWSRSAGTGCHKQRRGGIRRLL